MRGVGRWRDDTISAYPGTTKLAFCEINLRELSLPTLWGTIGLVPQQGYLFTGTIASHLRFGAPNAGHPSDHRLRGPE